MAEGNLPSAIAGNFLSVLVRYEISAVNATKFVEIGKKLTILTNAEEGCYFLNVGRDLFNPGVFHIQEAWKNQDLYNMHAESQGFNQLLTEAAAIGIISRDVYQLQGSAWTPLFVTTS
ncbi:hypothetical protein TARUN_65 [Trichoderma arundinaceum]|uniref:ABM domain-containing protein n=1 Tax=Trichoderma arundinaceum TaxID=490622 RepID=A0A395P1I8_TRIAR|nr:hypothetical protein TARUN_65 [Trichoderma arundinaceum]